MRQKVIVIGGGLAGSEAAWQLAEGGVSVDLYEMRPVRNTEAHTTDQLAELVCSNSFGSESPNAASRILKDELEMLGGFILNQARLARVPAGASLAVDRDVFARAITATLEKHPLITLHREEITEIPDDEIVIVATGPLTSSSLAASLGKLIGQQSLYFYDAISPIISTESLDLNQMYRGSRYGKGEPDFLNIPLTKEQYEAFVKDLTEAEVVMAHDFEKEKYFESCMPIETIAARGPMTLAFGPMKPVGLEDPRTGQRPYAVIQLRTENRHFTSYNLVGFQTKMKYKEQERVFRKLPGLESAEFLRLGSMHRNTYINSPQHLGPTLQLRNHPHVFVAGQLTGTEGYLESSATGFIAGTNALRLCRGESLATLPPETILGALLLTISDPTRVPFQPMNVNIGLFPPLGVRVKNKQERNAAHAERSVRAMRDYLARINESGPADCMPSTQFPAQSPKPPLSPSRASH